MTPAVIKFYGDGEPLDPDEQKIVARVLADIFETWPHRN